MEEYSMKMPGKIYILSLFLTIFILGCPKDPTTDPIDDKRQELTPGPAQTVGASATDATVTFSGAAGLADLVGSTDFTVSGTAAVIRVNVAADIASVTILFTANTSEDSGSFTVGVSAASTKIKSSGTVTVTQAGNSLQKRLTPIMGWASWNNYHAKIDEDILIKQMDALVSTGLADAGYTYFNIDDGFFGGRASDGTLRLDPRKFPNGMKKFADRAHEKGLFAGIYSDAGKDTCASIWDSADVTHNGVNYGKGVGLYGYEEKDLRLFLIDWGYDFIKVDWCGGEALNLSEQTQYTLIGNIIEKIRNETKKYKVYNVCRWKFPGAWVVDIADSWRVGNDIHPTFTSVLYQIDQVTKLAEWHGPGHVNDLDMMQVGRGMSNEADKTHFTMWCMMSTPLMLGNDLTTISQQTLDIVTNKDMIAINQDAACLQATLAKTTGDGQIWVKDLGYRGAMNKAVTLLNRGSSPLSMTVNFSELGFPGKVKARDLWKHEDLNADSSYTATVPGQGVVALRVWDENVGENTVTSFSINGVPGTISNAEGKISISLPFETDVTKLAPVIGHSGISIYPASGSVTNFTNPAAYSVMGKSGAVKTYTVTVTRMPKISVVVSGKLGITSGQVNLTQDGSVDWVQFQNGTITTPARKNIAAPVIQNIAAFPSLASALTDGPFTFTAADAAPGANPRDRYGLQTNGVDTGFTFSFSSRNNKSQTLKVYSSVWAGDIVMEFSVGGSVRYTSTYGKQNSSSGQLGQCLEVNFQIDIPTDVTVKLTCTEKYSSYNPSHCLQAITLSEDNSANSAIGGINAKKAVVNGAVLLDVRSAEEYDSAHIDGAINIEYVDILSKAEEALPDRNAVIIVYCSAGKRSAQALQSLNYLGYKNVYNLGKMSNWYEGN